MAPDAGLVPLGDWAVTRAEPRGPAWLLTVARPGLCWRAWWPGRPAAATLPLAVPADAVYLFDAATAARIDSAPAASNSGPNRDFRPPGGGPAHTTESEPS
jgi:hypothetical protein